jgi:hypothetical protein
MKLRMALGLVSSGLTLLIGASIMPKHASVSFSEQDSAHNVMVNFGAVVDPPLVKKFDFMNSGIVPMERYHRDIHLIDNLKAQSLRIDLFWGNSQINGWTSEMITGTVDNLRFNFSEIDELSQMLKEHNMAGYWSYCYNPLPLQVGNGHATQPSDLDAWRKIMYAFAKHFREENLRPEYQAIWNEPDLTGVFYNRPMDDYFQLYQYGVQGLREGDPDAYVGGPDLALFSNAWVSPFLDFVKENALPLDFFSFHAIGTSPELAVRSVRRAFSDYPYFEKTSLVFSELNPSKIYTGSSPLIHYTWAPIVLDNIEFLVEQTDITRAHWAQFMDSGVDTLGIIGIDGHRRATYNAFQLYAQMPVDRRELTTTLPVSGFASTDNHTAAVLLWNRSRSDQQLDIAFENVPFSSGTLRVYRIDFEHSSYVDNSSSEELAPVEVQSDLITEGLTWTGTLPINSVIYLEIQDGTGISELDSTPVADAIIRVDRYFPDRGKDNYAEFDRRTWITRLGMGEQDFAYSIVGVTVEGLPSKLDVSYQVDGEVQKLDENSVIGLRLDFEEQGRYTKSVLFHGGVYDDARSARMPWGTERQADQVVQVDNFTGFQLDPASYAPENWSGRVIVTFLMQDTGAHTRAKITLRPTGHT